MYFPFFFCSLLRKNDLYSFQEAAALHSLVQHINCSGFNANKATGIYVYLNHYHEGDNYDKPARS
ncbi:hypothetical protein QOZ98_000595 [Planomicrobium stackebrandtii]|uniref:Uncharacterized protein n=1 Tax=Planomicrobium stackebrandtii TaxID=253160 RepID=A0ABU0GQZ6_9BACL|nr:hypothetical protein [Planomicrobium stackebrandtii]